MRGGKHGKPSFRFQRNTEATSTHTLLFSAPKASSRPAQLPDLPFQPRWHGHCQCTSTSSEERKGQSFLPWQAVRASSRDVRTWVQVPEGNVYPEQNKHTSPGSNVLRRDALSHFVEINTKFMSSQPRVCLAHIRPRTSRALALLQELGAWGSIPAQGLLVSVGAVLGGLRPGHRRIGVPQGGVRARWDGARASVPFIRSSRSALRRSNACDAFSRCVLLPPGRPGPLGNRRPPASLRVWVGSEGGEVFKK